VNLLYHRILLDSRHRDPAILILLKSFAQVHQWSMGSLSSLEANRAIYLKYSALPVLLHHEPDHTARFFRRNHAQRVLGELTFVMQQGRSLASLCQDR
jgi:hypothetical protein